MNGVYERWGFLSAILWVALATGCSAVFGPDQGSQPGVMAFYGDSIVVEVPDTVRAGTAFQVAVRTYGGGCVSEGETEVREDGRSVAVRPYDVHSGADICTSELRLFDHRAMVTIGEPGTARITFHGRALPADTSVTVVRSVVVK